MCGKDLLMRESIRLQLDAMARELAGADASPLERLLIDRLIVTWLEVQHADLDRTMPTSGPENIKLALLRLKRQESAQKRYLVAVRTLALVRRLLEPKLMVEVHTGEAAAAVSRNDDGRPRFEAGGRMSRLFESDEQPVAQESGVSST
jgi:hypothetical protein